MQAARAHVAGQENVRQAVVVDVTDSDSATVVHIGVGLSVQRIIGGDGVRERDARLSRGQLLEQRGLPLMAAAVERQQSGPECNQMLVSNTRHVKKLRLHSALATGCGAWYGSRRDLPFPVPAPYRGWRG